MPNMSNTSTEITFELMSLTITLWEKQCRENEAKWEKKYKENEAKLRENIKLLYIQNHKLNINNEVIKTKINLWISLQPETVRTSVS